MAPNILHSVLYVDDDPDISAVVQASLCLISGLDVHLAASGEQAIAMADAVGPDLILMDVMMPGLDGPATLHRLRESVPTAAIPVIFMTAKVLPSEVAVFRGLGAIGVIGKPFDPLTLGRELVSVWNDAKMPARSALKTRGIEAVVPKAATLAGAFVRRTRNDVDALRASMANVEAGNVAALRDIEFTAHSIHGAAALFGFARLSIAGGALERCARTADPHLAERLTACIAAVALETDIAERGGPQHDGLFTESR